MDFLRQYAELIGTIVTAVIVTPIVKFVRIVFGQKSLLTKAIDDIAKLGSSLKFLEDKLRDHEDCMEIHIDRGYDAVIRQQILSSIQNLHVQLDAARSEIAALAREMNRRG